MMEERQNHKAVLFDLGGTLLCEDRLEIDKAISWLLESAGFHRSEMQPKLHGLFDEIRRSHRVGITEFPVRCFLNLAFALTGLDSTTASEDLELEFWKRLCSMKPLPGIEDVLSELQRQGLKLGVVSNSMFTRTVLCYELERNNLLPLFRVIISSADYGLQKPHPVIFEAALAQMGCHPGETWFVGDNFAKDVIGASQAGMRTIWLNKGEEDQALPSECVCINTWRDFLPLLGTNDSQMTR